MYQRIPYYVLLVSSLVFVWRIDDVYYFFRHFSAKNEREWKRYATVIFLSGLLDLPCALCYLVLYLTRWHYTGMMDEVRICKQNDIPHFVVFRYFLSALKDTPYFLALITLYLSVIRAISVEKKLVQVVLLDDKRKIIKEEFFSLCFDMPAMIASLFIILMGWHAKVLFKDIKDKEGFQKHKSVYKHLIQTFNDLPFIFLSFVLCLGFWRSIPLLKIIWSDVRSEDKKKGYCSLFDINYC
eukprot:TRINITY_DN9148_c0_g1_i1.p1 TRINITY_DN9148_c0_g1~~TRINITY_DN9148_c0_g1_i1.p1  ORF type:complete len:240 (-),score=30.95 TRINITY_DN9148_c0_g1_i1:1662-2381(-)